MSSNQCKDSQTFLCQPINDNNCLINDKLCTSLDLNKNICIDQTHHCVYLD
jgi:hypothetical protein